MSGVGEALSEPRPRQVLGALIAEAASDPELAEALRSGSSAPAGRARGPDQPGADRIHVPVSRALDQLVGPVYYRALLVGRPADEALVRAVIDSVVTADDR